MCFYEYKKVSSFGISLIPGLGDAKDLQEAIGGMDLITGKKLSALERVLAGACVIVPVVSGSMVRIAGKNANIAEKMSLLSEKQLFRKGAKAGITMCEDAKKEMEQLIREIRNILEEDVDIKRLFAKNKNTGLQVEIAGVGKVSLKEAEKLVGKDVRWSVGKSGINSIIKNGKVSIDDLKANPSVFSGKSVDEIAQALTDAGYDVTVKASTRSRSGAQIIKINNPGGGKNISQVQVSPGGGRHGSNSYVKISTTDQGIIKIIDGSESLYKTDGKETATIIFSGGN